MAAYTPTASRVLLGHATIFAGHKTSFEATRTGVEQTVDDLLLTLVQRHHGVYPQKVISSDPVIPVRHLLLRNPFP